jgi:hypothetical protein
MAGERLTIYRLENAEIVPQARMLGATNDALAGRFRGVRRTIDDWITTIPEFSKAVRQGREVADESVVPALFARATGMEQKMTKVFCAGLSGARPSDCESTHAQAVLARAFPSGGERMMRQVLAWIRARGAGQISREDVRRDALGQAPNAHQSLQVIQSLERAGFLRKAEVDYAGNGQPALRWDVTPDADWRIACGNCGNPCRLGDEEHERVCLPAYSAAIARGRALTTDALPETISSWIHL